MQYDSLYFKTAVTYFYFFIYIIEVLPSVNPYHLATEAVRLQKERNARQAKA